MTIFTLLMIPPPSPILQLFLGITVISRETEDNSHAWEQTRFKIGNGLNGELTCCLLTHTNVCDYACLYEKEIYSFFIPITDRR